MSKWRQKGFVQDSDEEEDESQLESQSSRQSVGLSGRVERVEDDLVPVRQHEAHTEEVHGVDQEEREEKHADEGINGIEKQETGIATPTKHSSPRRVRS